MFEHIFIKHHQLRDVFLVMNSFRRVLALIQRSEWWVDTLSFHHTVLASSGSFPHLAFCLNIGLGLQVPVQLSTFLNRLFHVLGRLESLLKLSNFVNEHLLLVSRNVRRESEGIHHSLLHARTVQKQWNCQRRFELHFVFCISIFEIELLF